MHAGTARCAASAEGRRWVSDPVWVKGHSKFNEVRSDSLALRHHLGNSFADLNAKEGLSGHECPDADAVACLVADLATVKAVCCTMAAVLPGWCRVPRKEIQAARVAAAVTRRPLGLEVARRIGGSAWTADGNAPNACLLRSHGRRLEDVVAKRVAARRWLSGTSSPTRKAMTCCLQLRGPAVGLLPFARGAVAGWRRGWQGLEPLVWADRPTQANMLYVTSPKAAPHGLIGAVCSRTCGGYGDQRRGLGHKFQLSCRRPTRRQLLRVVRLALWRASVFRNSLAR